VAGGGLSPVVLTSLSVVTVVVKKKVVILVSCLDDADFEHPIKPIDMIITMDVIKRFISDLFQKPAARLRSFKRSRLRTAVVT